MKVTKEFHIESAGIPHNSVPVCIDSEFLLGNQNKEFMILKNNIILTTLICSGLMLYIIHNR